MNWLVNGYCEIIEGYMVGDHVHCDSTEIFGFRGCRVHEGQECDIGCQAVW